MCPKSYTELMASGLSDGEAYDCRWRRASGYRSTGAARCVLAFVLEEGYDKWIFDGSDKFSAGASV